LGQGLLEAIANHFLPLEEREQNFNRIISGMKRIATFCNFIML